MEEAPTRNKPLEWTLLILFALTLVVIPLGTLVAAILLPGGLLPRQLLMVGAVLVTGPILVAATVVAAHRLDRLPLPKRIEGRPALENLLWTRLKVGGLLLHLLAMVAAFVLLLALLNRVDLVHLPIAGPAVQRGLLLLAAALGISNAYTLRAALRAHLDRTRSGLRVIMMSGALAVMAILVGVAFLLATPYADILTGTVRLQNGDIPVLILAAQGAVALSLIASRNLPGIAGLLEGRRRGQVVLPGRGSVFLPVFAAFSLLFLIFLLFILFGVGFIDFVSQVSSSPPLIGVMAFLFLAFLVSVAATFGLARSEANTELYIKPRDPAKTRQHWILGVSLAVAFLLFVPAYLLFDGYSFPRAGLESQHWIHFLCIGLLVAVGPYGFYMAREHRRIRLMEERFPDFLRDIASSHKGGLTLTQATVIASRGEYGPLSPEVQKMADQLKWNVSFNEALQRFSDRVRTPLVQRAVDLILQANRSGGATTDVLLAAARDARELKSLENDRRLSMSLYTVVIYVTFFVFLGVVAVMYSQFIPQLVASSEAAAESARELGGVSVGGIGGEVLRIEDFQLFYFLAAITQGLGDGIVAGLMGQGKAVLGLRHSFLMVLLSYLTFGFLL